MLPAQATLHYNILKLCEYARLMCTNQVGPCMALKARIPTGGRSRQQVVPRLEVAQVAHEPLATILKVNDRYPAISQCLATALENQCIPTFCVNAQLVDLWQLRKHEKLVDGHGTCLLPRSRAFNALESRKQRTVLRPCLPRFDDQAILRCIARSKV
eukprot:1721660-Prymnesium_polylepis.2